MRLDDEANGSETPSDDEQQVQRLMTVGIAAFVAVALSALLTAFIYVNHFGQSLSTDRDDWGVFGDFLGGVLNPAVGIVTIYLVLMNLIVQRKELQKTAHALTLQNIAMEEQSFQNTFFNWINSYNAQVNSIQWYSSMGGPASHGRSAISQLYKHMLVKDDVVRRLSGLMPTDYNSLFNESKIDNEKSSKLAERLILESWSFTKAAREEYFEGGFRSLLGILSWINSDTNSKIREDRKIECFKIIESQLSSAEKIFLLYESWSMTEQEVESLKKYRVLSRLTDTVDPFAKFMLTRAKNLS